MSHVQVLLRPVEKPLNEAGYPYSIWRFPPDIESEITTLATICQIKHQQCTPLAAGREEDIHEIDSSDDEGDENGSNFATDVAGRLRTATQKSTRMNFLDRMAELLCRKKEAHYVTCTSLMEREEEATILAARNASWDGLDIKLLEKIAKMLEAVASHDSSTEDAFDLRKEFSDYYSPRLNHHAKALLNLLGKSKGLEDFTSYINGFLNRRIPASAFVETVDNLGHSTDFYSQLKDNVLPSKMYRQCRELESICRPNHSFATFYQAAREIAGLKRVKIVLLPGYPPRQVQPQLSLCSEHYRARHPERLDVALKKDKWVHAEIRMILHLFSTDSVGRMFPYLGISKKTCLLCGHVLSHMGIFQARNNHGKVYGQWTLPHAIAMPAAIHGRLDATVQKLREVLHHECNSGDNKHLAPMKESTISTPVAERHDAWSPFNRSIPDLRSQSRENEWLSKRDMEEASGRNLTDHQGSGALLSSALDDEAQSEIEAFHPVPRIALPSCGKCGVQNDMLISCQRCNSVLYCDKTCQEKHWISHKFKCRLGRPLDEVDDLIQACYEKTIPTDDDTATAFGFFCFTSGFDRQRLFKLYCDLIVNWGVSEDELRQAWKSDKLRELIKFRGSQVPCARFRDEVRWLLHNDQFGSGVVASWSLVMETSAKHILDLADCRNLAQTLKPREKLESYVFWLQIRNGFMPDVDEDNWIYLGFCTASNVSQTQRIAQLYGMLIKRAKFEEFWQARVSSSMVALFQKHGLGEEIRKMRNFQTLMSAMGTWYQSVWELKRFTLLSQPFPHRAVAVDYGFRNCQTPVERMNLRDAYTQFFKNEGDEMTLHYACIENQLASFMESELGPLSFDAALLHSPYPLDGCAHMGMIVETAVLCSESAYNEVEKLHRAQGLDGVILTHPDEADAEFDAALEDRAAYLGRRVQIRTTRIGDVTMQLRSGM